MSVLVEGEADVPRGKRPLDQEKQIFTGQFSGGDNCLFDRAQARCDWNCQRPRGSPFRNRKWKRDLMAGLGQRPAILKSREALAETVLASRSSRASVEPCHSHADGIFLFVVLGGFQNAFTGRVEPRRNPVRCVRRVGAQ